MDKSVAYKPRYVPDYLHRHLRLTGIVAVFLKGARFFLFRIPRQQGYSSQPRAAHQCFQRPSAYFAESWEASNHGLISACVYLLRSHAHAKSNHERRRLFSGLSMLDQVYPAGLPCEYDSPEIQFCGIACVQLILAQCLYSGFAAYFLNGDQESACP